MYTDQGLTHYIQPNDGIEKKINYFGNEEGIIMTQVHGFKNH